jgi:hypothetical protein
MKKIVIISSAAFSLILGIALPAYAQQDEKNKKQDQHKQQETKKQDKHDQQHSQQPQNQDRVHQEKQQDQDRQQQTRQQQDQDRGRQQEQRIQQMQNQDRQQQQAQQQQEKQDQSRQQQRDQQERYPDQQLHDAGQRQRSDRDQDQQRIWQSTWQEHRAKSWQSDHRSWRQRGGYGGYRIPQDRYRGYFGPQHWFRISGRPFMVHAGYPRFQYEGYWITLLDPWPEYWSNDWYDNDDVYVDYRNDGYYMYNRRYPGAAIAVSISM